MGARNHDPGYFTGIDKPCLPPRKIDPKQRYGSGDSWMYPYQRTPMGNPYISPIYPYIVGVYGFFPKNPYIFAL